MDTQGTAPVIPLATFHPRTTDGEKAEDWVELPDSPWLAQGPPPGLPMDFQQVQDRLNRMNDEETAGSSTGLTVCLPPPMSLDAGMGSLATRVDIPLIAPAEESLVLPNFFPLLQRQAAEVAGGGGKPKWTKWLEHRQ